jgi:hypothetical protein
MNQKELPLKFEEIRTFGKVFSDTRKLIRENFVIFFKTILFLVGPFALLTCSMHAFYEVKIIGPNSDFEWTHLGSYIASKTILSQLKWVVNGSVTAMVVGHFIKVYRQKGPGKFEVHDITRSIFADFGGTLLTLLLVILVPTLIGIVAAALLYGFSEMSLGTGVFMIFLGYIGYFLCRFPFWFLMYSTFVSKYSEDEKLNAFEALRFSASVLKGNWWSTWVIFFCMWALLLALGGMISLPATILSWIAGLSAMDPTKNMDIDWVLVNAILVAVGEFAKTMIYSVFAATIAVHFYSLKEKKDGKGTFSMIESIGKNKDDDNIELTY